MRWELGQKCFAIRLVCSFGGQIDRQVILFAVGNRIKANVSLAIIFTPDLKPWSLTAEYLDCCTAAQFRYRLAVARMLVNRYRRWFLFAATMHVSVSKVGGRFRCVIGAEGNVRRDEHRETPCRKKSACTSHLLILPGFSDRIN
jgi:hypothetical protein